MSIAMPSPPEPRLAPLASSEKVGLRGRFFFLNGEKFFLKGITYEPFFTVAEWVAFLDVAALETDFELLTELGATGLRTFTPRADSLLDTAS